MKKINTLEISAKRWFQRSCGNTYHVVKAVVNGQEVVVSDISYGYDNHFLTTAADLLRAKGYEVPEDNVKAYSMMTKFPYTVEDVKRKKDLIF